MDAPEVLTINYADLTRDANGILHIRIRSDTGEQEVLADSIEEYLDGLLRAGWELDFIGERGLVLRREPDWRTP